MTKLRDNISGAQVSGYWTGRGPLVAPARERPEIVEPDVSPVGAFKRWLKRAKPGNRYTYFEGLSLYRARELDPTINDVATAVWAAMEQGFVHLVQKRTPNGYRYLAEKRKGTML